MSINATYNARRLIKMMIVGDMTEQYKCLWDYRAELLHTHTDSTVEIEHENFREEGRQPRFKKFYLFLGQLKKGFLDYCRQLVGVDGCYIKSCYGR